MNRFNPGDQVYVFTGSRWVPGTLENPVEENYWYVNIVNGYMCMWCVLTCRLRTLDEHARIILAS